MEETRRTLARMEVDAQRVALPKTDQEQVVVRPAETLDTPRWTWRERHVSGLSRE